MGEALSACAVCLCCRRRRSCSFHPLCRPLVNHEKPWGPPLTLLILIMYRYVLVSIAQRLEQHDALCISMISEQLGGVRARSELVREGHVQGAREGVSPRRLLILGGAHVMEVTVWRTVFVRSENVIHNSARRTRLSTTLVYPPVPLRKLVQQ